MIDKDKEKIENLDNIQELNGVCDECKVIDDSVSQNLILTGFKICNSCRISKTIYPV